MSRIDNILDNLRYGLKFEVGLERVPMYGYPHAMIKSSAIISAAWNDDIARAESMPLVPSTPMCGEVKLVWVYINGLLTDELLLDIVESGYSGYDRSRLKYLVEWFAIERTSRFYRFIAGIYKTSLDVLVDTYPWSQFGDHIVNKTVHLDILMEHKNITIEPEVYSRPDMTVAIFQKLRHRLSGTAQLSFALTKLAENLAISIQDITQLDKVPWDILSARADVVDWVRRNPDLPWCWDILSYKADIQLVWEFPTRKWSWSTLSTRSDLDPRLVETYPHCNWDWIRLTLTLPIEFIFKHLNTMPWSHFHISLNPQVTMKTILDHPKFCWDFQSISRLPLITWQDILDHPDKDWNYDVMVTCGAKYQAVSLASSSAIKRASSKVPLDVLREHPNFDWDRDVLAERSELFPQLLDIMMFNTQQCRTIVRHKTIPIGIAEEILEPSEYRYLLTNPNPTWDFAMRHIQMYSPTIIMQLIEKLPLTTDIIALLPEYVNEIKYMSSYYTWDDIKDMSPYIIRKNPNVSWRKFYENPELMQYLMDWKRFYTELP